MTPLTAYRYPGENTILGLTLLGLLVITAITAGATLCLAPLVIIIFVVLAAQMSGSHHQALLKTATHVSPTRLPGLAAIASECTRRLHLPDGEVDFFVATSRMRNAYTFGLSNPKVVVIYSALLETLTPDEIRFVLGHELGHVGLGHTWINSILGGMAGIPTTFEGAILLTLAFRWWNRACEYSADRAGLLCCGSVATATSALVKLIAGQVRSPAEMQRILALVEQEDDSPLNVIAETFSTHPMIVRRINQLRTYTASSEYKRLMGRL